MKQVNWGIIGLGAIATQFANGFEFVYIEKDLSINDQNKIREYEKSYKISKKYCYDNYESLIKDKDIDIVYIALPTALHFKWIVKCLKAQKRVLVEKPATLNSKEAVTIKNLLLEESIFFTEAFMYLYHPKIKKVLELIKLGNIGDLLSMESFL